MIYDTHNPEVINFLFQEAKPGVRILDVGCGTGKLGKLIKSKINCYIEGIEIDPEAAKIAQKGYDKIIEINLEELMDLAEGLIKHIVKKVLEENQEELKILDKELYDINLQRIYYYERSIH